MPAVADWFYARRAPVSNFAGLAVAAVALALPGLMRVERRAPDSELTAYLEERRSEPASDPVRSAVAPTQRRASAASAPRPAPALASPVAAVQPTPVPARAPEPFAKTGEASDRPAADAVPGSGRAVLGESQPAPVRAAESPAAAPAGAIEPATPAARAADLQSGYERQVLAALERAKRYPTSREARLTRPQGAARIWVEIGRDGRTLDVGLAHSSGSNLLDAQALSTARPIVYPPFPEAAFNGAASHRFIATLKYELASD